MVENIHSNVIQGACGGGERKHCDIHDVSSSDIANAKYMAFIHNIGGRNAARYGDEPVVVMYDAANAACYYTCLGMFSSCGNSCCELLWKLHNGRRRIHMFGTFDIDDHPESRALPTLITSVPARQYAKAFHRGLFKLQSIPEIFPNFTILNTISVPHPTPPLNPSNATIHKGQNLTWKRDDAPHPRWDAMYLSYCTLQHLFLAKSPRLLACYEGSSSSPLLSRHESTFTIAHKILSKLELPVFLRLTRSELRGQVGILIRYLRLCVMVHSVFAFSTLRTNL